MLLAEDRASAVETFQTARPLVVLLDLGLPPHPGDPEEGLATLSELLALERLAKIVIITGQGEKGIALRAIGAGAYDFLVKPVDTEELKLSCAAGFHVASLEVEYRQMQQMLGGDAFAGMMGTSPAIRAVFDSIRKVATTDAPVLLLGESGTGKEMAARAIHDSSARKDGPFIAINCSAIPETLLESELFGHEKGSFTGAHAQRKGRFEMASGGTLFLDEIGEIPLRLQVKLLRFLQEQCIERVGGRQPIQIDTRIVTATNSDLKKGMVDGTFREDLYYRLAVVQMMLPPLREREGDIRLLAPVFPATFWRAGQQDRVWLSTRRPFGLWTGIPGRATSANWRIAFAARSSCARENASRFKTLNWPPSARAIATNLKDARENLERDMIQNALRKHSGKIAPAASELGVSRPTLYDLMEKLGIANP